MFMLPATLLPIFNQALRHHQAGQLPQAETLYRQVLAAVPDHSDSLNLLGVLIFQRDKEGGLRLIQSALAANPCNANAFFNLGNALKDMRRFDEAIAAYRNALALNPSDFEALTNLGAVHLELFRVDEAIVAWKEAIALNPSYAVAYSNLADALLKKGLAKAALALCQRAIELDPKSAEAHSNMGNCLKALTRFDEAVAAFRVALAFRPDFAGAHLDLGTVYKELGNLDDSIAAFRSALLLNPTDAVADGNLLLTLHYHPDTDRETLAKEHVRWNAQHASRFKAPIPLHGNVPDPDRRLRIGYVSADFSNHSVGRFLLPLFGNHDKDKFEIYAYSNVRRPDNTTEQLRSSVSHWKDIFRENDERAVKEIQQDAIDILVDLSLHSGASRILVFARKPAPVQVTYLAYCSTSGLDTIDYRLSDPYLDPPEAEKFYSEQTVCLPETYWCFQPPPTTPQLRLPPAVSNGYVTFGSLNNFCKLNERTFRVWSRLLAQVPDSRLFMHAPEGKTRKNLLERFCSLGIASERIAFSERVPIYRYLELYNRFDLALDTFPFAGGTTTCDALWMGVPVVTLRGRFAFGRSGVSILSNVGLPELIADTEEDYVRIASGLARDIPRLRGLRVTLRESMRRSPLMDAPRFTRGLENVYRTMWRTWCSAHQKATF